MILPPALRAVTPATTLLLPPTLIGCKLGRSRVFSNQSVFFPCLLPWLSLSLSLFLFTQVSKFLHGRDAMAEEYNALMANHTWDLVPCPPKQNLVGSKWVYRVKYRSNGTAERHKACPVAQRFHQQDGFDYHETFYPIVKPATLYLILSLAILSRWTIR